MIKTFLLLLALACVVVAQTLPTARVEFDAVMNGAEITNQTFRVHVTGNPATPLEQWAQFELFVEPKATNGELTTLISTNRIDVLNPAMFFTVSSSNLYGIDFSDTNSISRPTLGRSARLR